jgi:hypothetical protein
MQHNELSPLQMQTVLSRLPSFELSYETITHKKDYPQYNIGFAIPAGKKYYAYFSFHEGEDVCYLMEIRENKHDTYHKKISKISIISSTVPHELCVGTLLYGTLVGTEAELCTTTSSVEHDKSFFVIEDIVQYKGFVLGNISFSRKIGYMDELFKNYLHTSASTTMGFAFPYMWDVACPEESSVMSEYERVKNNLFYTTHHIQLRKWDEISPHLNIPLNKIGSKPVITATENKTPVRRMSYMPVSMDFNKPQYKYSCVFHVCADIQYDVYHLYACGKNSELVYYNVAGIPTLKTSVFMNSLFRKIKENQNIDYIEESDDEDDFQNAAEDKYVDLNKNILIECTFHYKFKKWVPVRVAAANSRIVHISKL